MLTGRHAFEGDDVTDTIAAVVRGEPAWGALPASLPDPIRLLVKRGLEKDRSARISDIGTVRFLMTDTLTLPAAASAPAGPEPMRKWAIPVAATALVVAGLTSAA